MGIKNRTGKKGEKKEKARARSKNSSRDRMMILFVLFFFAESCLDD